MKYFGKGLSELHKEINRIIRKKDSIEQAKQLFLELHARLYPGKISDAEPNEVDFLLADLTPADYAAMPESHGETIAWALWHIARIEDLTMNMLVNLSGQIFDDDWKKKMHADITDTGNALSQNEIVRFSEDIVPSELLAYRYAVGCRTREIVRNLTAVDITRNIEKKDLNRILTEGGVTMQTTGLLDYWGSKDVAGILLMPPSRHEIIHLNDCCKWKQMIMRKKKVM